MMRAFYRENAPDLTGITEPHRRQFRFHLRHGFRKLPRQVRSAEDLRRWLVRLAPLDAYYSVARWLSPTSVGPMPLDRENMAANLFLGADLVFDIDVAPLSRSNLEKAQAIAREAIGHLDARFGSRPRYVAFSGGKGFHLVYDDPFPPQGVADPFERERIAAERRKELAEEMLAASIAIDAPITCDTRRILRVPGTVNSKTNYVCTVLQEKDLHTSPRELLARIPRCAPGILERGNDAILWIAGSVLGRLERAGVSSPSTYSSYLTNRVLGTADRHVPFFRFPRRRVESIIGRIAQVQREYSLGTVYLLDDGDCWSAFSLRTLQLRRCQKVVNAAGSLDARRFLRVGQQFLRVGPTKDRSGRVVRDAPRLLRTLQAESGQPESKPHRAFFSQWMPLEPAASEHGSEEVRLSYCEEE